MALAPFLVEVVDTEARAREPAEELSRRHGLRLHAVGGDVADAPAATERRGLPLGIGERRQHVADLSALLMDQRPELRGRRRLGCIRHSCVPLTRTAASAAIAF